MTTQQLYQKVINEQMSKTEFLWNVRRDDRLTSIVSNIMSFEDTISVLKGKGHVWDASQEAPATRPFDFIGTMKSLNEASKKENKLKGGKGDKLDADHVNYHEFTKGWKHELEHTDDIDKAKEIALDHIAEDPNYYTRLDMVEYQAEKSKKKTASKKTKEGSMVDTENQMTPVDKKKVKSNVKAGLGKQEKAKSKNAGAKVMKGGSGEMKTIKESYGDFEKAIEDKDLEDIATFFVDDIQYNNQQFSDEYKKVIFDNLDNDEIEELNGQIDSILDRIGGYEGHEDDYHVEPKGLKKSAKSDTGDLTEENVGVDTGLTYDPKQLYMYKRKDDKNPSARQLDKDEFDHIIKDPKTILFKKTSEKELAADGVGLDDKDINVKNIAALNAKSQEKDQPSKSSNQPKKNKYEPTKARPVEDLYSYEIVPKLGGKSSVVTMTKNQADNLLKNPKYADKFTITQKSTQPVGRGDNRKVVTTYAPGVKAADTNKPSQLKDRPSADIKGIKSKTKEPETDDAGSYVGVKRKSEPNLGVKKIKPTPSIPSAAKRWQVIDKSDPNNIVVVGADDDREKAKAMKGNNQNLQVIPVLGLKTLQLEPLEEVLDDTTKKDLESANVSFIIPGEGDADQKLDVSDTVKTAVFNNKDNSLTINLAGGNRVVFTPDAAGKPVGVYFSKQDGQEVSKQVLDVQPPLTTAINKVYASKKKEEPAVNETLENYIRERIKQAIKEGEEGQYVGMIGPDTLKKKLKEYMARYEWGFQDSGNPAKKARGQEVHGIVSKMIHELGDDGVAIFNEYAPEGYQIKSKEDLGSDPSFKVGLGPQDRDFNPEELTGRGGRVAEATYDEEDVKRYTDRMDKNIDDPSLEKDMADFGEKAMTNTFGNSAAQTLVARILGEYISKKGAQNIKNSNIIRGFHKLADKNK